jgi:hypothetical protein
MKKSIAGLVVAVLEKLRWVMWGRAVSHKPNQILRTNFNLDWLLDYWARLVMVAPPASRWTQWTDLLAINLISY